MKFTKLTCGTIIVAACDISNTVKGITRRKGIKSGRPILVGSKLSVLQVHQLVRIDGISPNKIVKCYTGVTDTDQIEQALVWADKHPDEMDRLRKKRAEVMSQVEARGEPA